MTSTLLTYALVNVRIQVLINFNRHHIPACSGPSSSTQVSAPLLMKLVSLLASSHIQLFFPVPKQQIDPPHIIQTNYMFLLPINPILQKIQTFILCPDVYETMIGQTDLESGDEVYFVQVTESSWTQTWTVWNTAFLPLRSYSLVLFL